MLSFPGVLLLVALKAHTKVYHLVTEAGSDKSSGDIVPKYRAKQPAHKELQLQRFAENHITDTSYKNGITNPAEGDVEAIEI